MVLVANKKTKKQMERDLTLFLNTHTAHFVEWLTQVLDKLQTITLAKGNVGCFPAVAYWLWDSHAVKQIMKVLI